MFDRDSEDEDQDQDEGMDSLLGRRPFGGLPIDLSMGGPFGDMPRDLALPPRNDPSTPGDASQTHPRPITAMVMVSGTNGITLLITGADRNFLEVLNSVGGGDSDTLLRQMLSLAAFPTPRKHLDKAAIVATFPTQYCSIGMDQHCTVCQENIEVGESYRVLSCGHHFHASCIDEWLTGESNGDSCDTDLCPNCRAPVETVVVEELPVEAIEDPTSAHTSMVVEAEPTTPPLPVHMREQMSRAEIPEGQSTSPTSVLNLPMVQ